MLNRINFLIDKSKARAVSDNSYINNLSFLFRFKYLISQLHILEKLKQELNKLTNNLQYVAHTAEYMALETKYNYVYHFFNIEMQNLKHALTDIHPNNYKFELIDLMDELKHNHESVNL